MRRWMAPIGIIVCLFLGWEFTVRWFEVPHYLVPAPSRVFVTLWENRAIFPEPIWMTFQEALIGLIISVLLGVCVAIWIHRMIWAQRAIYPLLVASQAIPLMVLSPVLNVWFGYSLTSKVIVVVLWTFFPIAVTMVQGLRMVDPELIALMRTMRASSWQIFWKVEWPSALPHFFSGLRMAALFSVVSATIGEWLGAENGLGVLTRRASSSMQTDLLFAGAVLLMALGVLMVLVIVLLEKRLFSKHRPQKNT